jgi:hypothetical protein
MEARLQCGRARGFGPFSPHVVALVAAVLALTLTATAGGVGGGNQPIRGVVVGVSNESLEVQTASGAVTVAIADETRVVRQVSGTVADLRKRQVVELVLDAKTSRVTRVHIDVPGTKLAPGRDTPARGRSGARTLGPVRIVSVSGRSIRVRYANRRVATYRLARKPTVIKDLPGRVADIAIGQTVLVTRTRGGRVADLIVILAG